MTLDIGDNKGGALSTCRIYKLRIIYCFEFSFKHYTTRWH